MSRGPTRRSFLASAGVAGAVALAGCGGGNSGGGASGGSGDFVWLYGESDRALSQQFRRVINANARNIQIDLRKGGSDVQNVKKLGNGEVDFAVVGVDLAYFARNGTGIQAFQSGFDNIRVTGALYPRPVTIFGAPDLEADTVGDISGRTVNIGQAASQLAVNASQVLTAAEAEYTPGRSDMATGIQQAASGQIGAAAAIGDWPIPAAQEVARNNGLKLLGLTDSARQRALSGTRWFIKTRLPAAVYQGINYPVKAVGYNTVIATRSGISEGKMVRITEAIFENTDQITVRSEYISKDTAQKGVPLELHEGSNNYYGIQ